MRYPAFHVRYSGGSLDQDINEAIVINSRIGLKTRIGTANFQVLNINEAFNPGSDLKIDGTANIWFSTTGPAGGSTLVFPGLVNEIIQDTDTRERNIKINLVNKTERLLSYLDAKDYPSGGTIGGNPTTASNVIKDVISRVNDTLNFKGETNITTNNVTATPFTFNFGYGYNYKSAFDIVKELSADEYTNDGQYIYYIDEDNDLHFKPRPGITGTTPSLDEYDFTKFRATYGVFDVINAVIINAGKTVAGITILNYALNILSIAEIGFRWKYLVVTEIAKEWINQNPGESEVNQLAGIKKWAKAYAEKYVEVLGEPRWRIEATMKGDINYLGTSTRIIQGDIVKMTSTPNNWDNGKYLRVMDIRHNFTGRGWFTTLQLEEDIDTKRLGGD